MRQGGRTSRLEGGHPSGSEWRHPSEGEKAPGASPHLFVHLAVLFLAACLIWLPKAGAAGVEPEEQPAQATGRLTDYLTVDLRLIAFGVCQQPVESTQNPSNNFLKIPLYVGDVEARPDLRLSAGPLELGAKPRMRLDDSVWEEGSLTGRSHGDSDFYLNEYIARLKVREGLFVSYGRENLQWGPSFLFSPSNPFFQDNGRRNPYLEVPGMDFGRVVWVASAALTFSFIANTTEGLNRTTGPGAFLSSVPPPPFEPTYTVKADYTGRDKYASLILSHRKDGEGLAGFYGGWTVADAILLYGEGSVSQGSRGLYPEGDRFSPFGATMAPLHTHDPALYPALLAGGAYTLESKGTFSVEYAYYGPGYGPSDAETYYGLRRKAAEAFDAPGMISGLAQETLGETAITDLRFLRRNYALIQYSQPSIRNRIDLTFRWTQNLDDGSGQFTALAAYELGKHVELFSVATAAAGGKNTEFGSILGYEIMAGLQYTF